MDDLKTSLRPVFDIPVADWTSRTTAAKAAFPQGYLPLYLDPFQPDDAGIACRVVVTPNEVLWVDISWQGNSLTSGSDPPLLQDLGFSRKGFEESVCDAAKLVFTADLGRPFAKHPSGGRWMSRWRAVSQGRWLLELTIGDLLASQLSADWWRLTLDSDGLRWSSPIAAEWLSHVAQSFLRDEATWGPTSAGCTSMLVGQREFGSRVFSDICGSCA